MKSTLGQVLQRALQLDFFNDLFSTERATPEVSPPPRAPKIRAPKSAAPATPAPPGGKIVGTNQRQIQLKDQLLEYSLLRSKRRSIGFLINHHGLRVTAPRWVTIADIELAIQEKQRWILSKLSERHARLAQREKTAMRWQDGASFLYLGKPLTLRLFHASHSNIRHDQGQQELLLTLPQTGALALTGEALELAIKDKLKAWLQQEARQLFAARMPVYAEKLGVRYHSMSLSSATTRWGSCTSQGKIRLNWRLIHFAPELIDYVIAHELAHLLEMNHSARFWLHVQAVFPNFELARHHLRQHAATDFPTF